MHVLIVWDLFTVFVIGATAAKTPLSEFLRRPARILFTISELRVLKIIPVIHAVKPLSGFFSVPFQ
jgi:hypothetical protein